jgi:arylsulfatase
MKTGFDTGKKIFKVHLDGYNFMPYFKGEAKQGPRDQGGNLNALRWNDWKLSFEVVDDVPRPQRGISRLARGRFRPGP